MTRARCLKKLINPVVWGLLLAVAACGDDFVDPAGSQQGGDPDSGVTLPQPDSGASAARCGDGVVDPGEACDGSQLNGNSCVKLGHDSGQLSCRADCTLDTSSCKTSSGGRSFGQKCGGQFGSCKTGLMCVLFNEAGKKEGYCTQECSSSTPCPSSPTGAQCAFKLSSSGKTICGFLCSTAAPACPTGLSCSYSKQGGYHYCTTDPPAKCGNSKRELAEQCDGKDLNGATCKAFGYSGGAVKCTAGCKLDNSGCTGQSSCGSLPARDCSGSSCGKLVAFAPTSGPGYLVTHGAKLSWARQDTMMLVKYAAAAVACMMPGSYPLGLGDMSMQSGGTPKTSGGQLRHPSGTHDYGRDIDIAYYQTGQPNNYLRPVCQHSSGGKEQYHCTAKPNILDVPRTTLFIAKLLESSRVRVIGVDGQIGPLLKAQAQKLASQGLITSSAASAFSNKLAYEVTDTKMGWYRFHHHHLHLSTYTKTSASAPAQPPFAGIGDRGAGIGARVIIAPADMPRLDLYGPSYIP